MRLQTASSSEVTSSSDNTNSMKPIQPGIESLDTFSAYPTVGTSLSEQTESIQNPSSTDNGLPGSVKVPSSSARSANKSAVQRIPKHKEPKENEGGRKRWAFLRRLKPKKKGGKKQVTKKTKKKGTSSRPESETRPIESPRRLTKVSVVVNKSHPRQASEDTNTATAPISDTTGKPRNTGQKDSRSFSCQAISERWDCSNQVFNCVDREQLSSSPTTVPADGSSSNSKPSFLKTAEQLFGASRTLSSQNSAKHSILSKGSRGSTLDELSVDSGSPIGIRSLLFGGAKKNPRQGSDLSLTLSTQMSNSLASNYESVLSQESGTTCSKGPDGADSSLLSGYDSPSVLSITEPTTGTQWFAWA